MPTPYPQVVQRIEIDANTYSYSQGVLVEDASKLMFVSGQVPATSDGRVPATFGEQCRLAWANVFGVLDRAGLGPANLVKVTVFLSDRQYRAENAQIRHEVLGDHTPALTVIIAGIYDEAWLLEIEAMACA
jgi:enamine deaminase RidA (YjgF/YER057c/UK114 family)